MTSTIARALALAAACVGTAHAQFQFPEPAPLPAPALSVWTSGVVNAVELDADGGLIVAGSFSELNGVPRWNLARLRPDGTLDPDFMPNPDAGVQDIAIAGDGLIYVVGNFSIIGAQSHSRLARVLPSGAVDPGWTPSLDSSPQAIAVGDDEVYVGGFFNTVNGQSRQRLARILTAGIGTLDTDWAPTPNSTVGAMAFDANDNSLFIGGDFISINGTTRARIAKLDGGGTGDILAWDAPASSSVASLELDGAGSLYVAGGFTVIGANGGAGRQHVARLSTTTGEADSFSLTFPQGTDGAVADIDVLDNAVYLAGSFTHVNGTPRRYAARVSTVDATLEPLFAPVLDRPPFIVVAPGNGAVYLSGSATRYVNGDTRLGAAPVDEDSGATLAPLDVVIPGTVYSMVALPGGGQLIGGDFYRIGAAPRENLAILRADGSVDPDWVAGVNDRVRVVAVDAGGTAVYAAGVFDLANDAPRNAFAKFSATGAGTLQAWDAGITERAGLEPVRAIAIDAAGAVYVGGSFQEIGGQVRCCIAKLSGLDASLDMAWGSGANSTVSAIAIAPDGSVYASGFFSQINGNNRGGLAKLDPATGAVDLGFAADLPASQTVMSFGFAGNDLYLAGSFTNIGAQPRSYLARINAASGAVDPAWAPSANRDVYNVLPAGDSVFLAGNFSSIGGTLRIQLAKVSALDGALDPEWDPQAYDGPVIAALLDAQGNVVIAGGFRNIGTSPRQGLAAIGPTTDVVVLPPHIFGNGFED